MTDPLPVFVDPADLKALTKSLRHRANVMEMASKKGTGCFGCPLGGVAFAFREAATDLERLTRGEKVTGLDLFR